MNKIIYILIGPQGSGKTYWAENVLMKYKKDIERISQDDQGRQGHRDLFTRCIDDGKSVVVDRMNFNFAQRYRYLEQIKDLNYKVIFVWFKLTKDVCLDRLKTRKNHPTISIDSDHNKMIDLYFNEFEAPRSDEYDELITINEKKIATTLDLTNTCNGKRIIIVGDIHGCFDQFMGLLKKCEYRPDDIVISTGDLVDRGPKIKETLQWFFNTHNAYAVMGNHDNKLMRYWKGNPVKITNGLNCTIDQCVNFEPTVWAAWLQALPHVIILPEICCAATNKKLYVVHAGVDGRNDIDKQKIETCLYTRFVNGKDFFDKDSGTPWWETLDGSYCVAHGHIMTEITKPNEYTYCLDGGACQGGPLRCLIVDNQRCQIKEENQRR